MLCSDKDLKDIGIPLGPRKKILNCVKKWKVIPASPVLVEALWLMAKEQGLADMHVGLIVCGFLSTPIKVEEGTDKSPLF